jgi:hypothetical protein
VACSPCPLRQLDEVLAGAGLTLNDDTEIECLIRFDSTDTAVRAFVGAGPTALAIRQAGEATVAQAMREALGPFTSADGRVTIPAWYRVVFARG